MIASHNSGTGEKGRGLLSWIVTPFARCQKKTVVGQWKSGVRMFDFRVVQRGVFYYHAHGLWTSSKRLEKTLYEINDLAKNDNSITYVMITLERGTDNPESFERWIRMMVSYYNYIVLASVSMKKPTWKTLYCASGIPSYERKFTVLDGRSWHTIIPIPWLWDKINGKHSDNDQKFIMYDFV